MNNNLITYSQTHVTVSDEITFNDWLGSVNAFAKLGSAWQWWLGDLLLAGREIFGDDYVQAVGEEGGVTPKTATNIMIMAEKFVPSRRRSGLHWSHHRAVRSIPNESKQDEWLDIAVSENLTVRALERRVEEDLAQANSSADESVEADAVCGDETQDPPGDSAVSAVITGNLVKIENVVIDLEDETSKRNYEKMLEELTRVVELRMPNLFMEKTQLYASAREILEAVKT